jgi:hypothetical protein
LLNRTKLNHYIYVTSLFTPTPINTFDRRSFTNRSFFVAASNNFAACSFGWWLMAGADLFSEKRTAGWFVQREKYC